MASVQMFYDDNENPRYYSTVYTGQTDINGDPVFQRIEVPASQVKTVTESDGEGGTYTRLDVSDTITNKILEENYLPPAPKAGYERPKEVQQSDVFTTQPGLGENVNDFSFGQLGNIYDSINSGAYRVSPDKSSIILQNGQTYPLQSLGNNLYDIPIGAKSGSYRVAIGVTDDNKAVFNKNFIDNQAIRYVGGSPGGMLSSFIQDIGPIGNIALAVATGGLSIPEQIAAQAAYNMAGGQNFDDALKNAAITTAIGQGVKYGASEFGSGLTGYEGLESGLGGGEYYESLGAAVDDIMLPELTGYEGLGGGLGGGELYDSLGGGVAGGLAGSAGSTALADAVYGGAAAGALGALGLKDLATLGVLGTTAASILNPPKLPQATTPTTGFPLAPIPSDWRSPTYNQNFTPIDLNSLFTDQNLLIGTQWENLPPEIQFANAPTMQALTDIIGSTLGQNAISDQSVKG